MTARFTLEQYGIDVAEIHRNLPPAVLYEHALAFDPGSMITSSGAKSGLNIGLNRSPASSIPSSSL